MRNIFAKTIVALFVFWFSFSTALWYWEATKKDKQIEDKWEASYREIEIPPINCTWLPFCPDTNPANPLPAKISSKSFLFKGVVWNFQKFIIEAIKRLSVTGVLSCVLAGMYMMTSMWEEEKLKRGKKWLIASILGVVVGMSGYGAVKILNSFEIWGSTDTQTEANP